MLKFVGKYLTVGVSKITDTHWIVVRLFDERASSKIGEGTLLEVLDIAHSLTRVK